MSSREIAERTEKHHHHVIKDIEKMLDELEIPQTTFRSGYLDANNQKRKQYLLPKRECLILASGYSIKLRAIIVDRWMYLEGERSHLQSLILNKPKDWVKTFPDFLYEQMYRLQGQSFDKRKNKQSWVGHWTNKYIYRTLDKQLVKELKEARSKSKAKSVGAFLHQYLADDASDALRSHIEQIYGMMRAAKDADHFDSLWRQAFEHKDQLSLLMR